MRIERAEVIPLLVPLGRTFAGSYYSMLERATIVTRLYMSNGIIGESYNGDEPHTQHLIADIIANELVPLLQDTDAGLIENCWQTMLRATRDILRDRRLVLMAIACVDSALWDAAGKTAGMALYRMWGGAKARVPVIAIGGYYGNAPEQLGAEVEAYLELGIGGCKMKVGAASPREDAARFIAMREAAGGRPHGDLGGREQEGDDDGQAGGPLHPERSEVHDPRKPSSPPLQGGLPRRISCG